MFFSCISSISFENSQSLRESSSVAICLLSNTCRTLKSNKRIHVNQRIIKTSEKSAAERLNWTIRILTSISIINRTSYSQKRTFFNVFSSSRHSRFVTSYFDSNQYCSQTVFITKKMIFARLRIDLKQDSTSFFQTEIYC